MKIKANDMPNRGRDTFVTVDGVIVHGCVEVDTECGIAVLIQSDDGGKPLRNDTGDGIATYELHGRVELSHRPDA